MPIYEYICQDCGQKYDKFVRSSLAKVDLKCPKCGSDQARKALSLFGMRGDSSPSGLGVGSSAASCAPAG